jgi:hypothetical protein
MDIDRKNWKVLADEMEAVLGLMKEAMEMRGLEIGKISGQYGGTSGTFRFKVTQTAAASTDGKTEAQRDFELLARRFGMEPEWFGVTVPLSPLTSDQTATITGLKPRSSKYPVLGTDERGRNMKYTTQVIRRAFMLAGYNIPYYWEDNLAERQAMPSAS